jgi:hypothetical protein
MEIVVLRTTAPELTRWDDLLPDQAKRPPDKLARIDAYLDDDRVTLPWRALFCARLGRRSVPVPTLLRLLYLKHRYQLGYETLCTEVGDSISWRRFCHIPLDQPVPHPPTLSKLVRRAGPEVIGQLNHALLAKLAGDKLLRARKLRIDTTVVEADIDDPTDVDPLERAIRTVVGWCGASRPARSPRAPVSGSQPLGRVQDAPARPDPAAAHRGGNRRGCHRGGYFYVPCPARRLPAPGPGHEPWTGPSQLGGGRGRG